MRFPRARSRPQLLRNALIKSVLVGFIALFSARNFLPINGRNKREAIMTICGRCDANGCCVSDLKI